MGKRFVGATFCLMAALLFAGRYIAAAIFMSNISSWNAELFGAGLEYVGFPLLLFSILSLLCGLGYLIWAEASERKK